MADAPPTQLFYVGDADRYYATLGLTPEPGMAYGVRTAEEPGLPDDGTGHVVDPGDGRWTADADVAAPVADAWAKAQRAEAKLDTVTTGAMAAVAPAESDASTPSQAGGAA